MTYSIQIPLQTTIEIEINGTSPMSYTDILSKVTEVDLREAVFHLPMDDINNAYIKAVAKSNIKISAMTN